MLPEGTIRAQRIWKRFRPDRSTALLRYQLNRVLSRLARKPLRWQWALRSVDFTATPGTSVGLVGHNGSGKSTLLKVLCRVMYPYAGRVEVSGRVGALIEVRAGISPELTGRENIGLYGTLLGLSRKQVMARFDEIVEFAELERAIDRQVKFYSMGMQMRLGFGVAAYLEPDILLVDEVLSVGDAAFQQRCLNRMRTVLNQGTTLVYVSHDLATVEAVCSQCVWLRDGVVAAEGPVQEVLSSYRGYIEEMAEVVPQVNGPFAIRKVTVINPQGIGPATLQPLDITIYAESQETMDAVVHIGVSEGTADPIFTFRWQTTLHDGANELRCSLPQLPLPRGRYFVWCSVVPDVHRAVELLPWQPVGQFDVAGPELSKTPRAVVRRAPFYVEATFDAAPAQLPCAPRDTAAGNS